MNNLSDSHGILYGHIRSAMWKLALPSIASGLLMSANSIADKLFMGRLGVDALAIVTVVHEIRLALMTILVAFSVGAAAIIGRAIGAGDKAEAAQALRLSFAQHQSILLALAARPSPVSTLSPSPASDPLLQALAGQGALAELFAAQKAALVLGASAVN